MKTIVLTGGGTAGHVMPNLSLVPYLTEAGFTCTYIGSHDGIEKELVQKAGLPYHAISAGKLRRYFDWQNFTDMFRVIKGVGDARKALKKIKPDVVFSKGGFVTVPVTLAAKMLKIPVVAHESDMTPGLANKLAFPFCTKILTTFPETCKYIKGEAVAVGAPIRDEIKTGDRATGLSLLGFTGEKPVLLVMGGSLGSQTVNGAVQSALPELLKQYQICHIVGKGNLNGALMNTPGYRQFEYVAEDLKHLFAAADLMVSRAGANAIHEILALQLPALLIPLGLSASRGDQIMNANSFQKQGYVHVLEEEGITGDKLLDAVCALWADRDALKAAMAAAPVQNTLQTITDILVQEAK